MGSEIAVVCSTGNHERLDPGTADLLIAYHVQTEAEKGTPVAGIEQLPDRYRAEVEDPRRAFRGQTVLVAMIGLTAVGCAVLTTPVAGRCEIKRLWTNPAFRGQGVASQLIEGALARADEAGVSTVQLSVWNWRLVAIALYERLGFVKTTSWEDREELVCMERDMSSDGQLGTARPAGKPGARVSGDRTARHSRRGGGRRMDDSATVVLVHGLFGAFGDDRLWSRLSSHQLLVPDLLGYGANTATEGPITLDAQVDHLRELLGSRPVHVVGHSVGGVVATLYAHRYVDDVASVVNVEGNFTLADAFWSAELAKMPADEAARLLEQYRADPGAWFGGTSDPYLIDCARAMLAFQPAGTLQAMAASVVAVTGAETWEPLVREVFSRTPVRLVAGQRSRTEWNVPDWAMQAAQDYTELPDVGHVMMFEAPEAFGDALSAIIGT